MVGAWRLDFVNVNTDGVEKIVLQCCLKKKEEAQVKYVGNY